MALIVENGTIVADADTYVSRSEFIAYAAKQGVAIPSTDAADVFLIKAMNYLYLYAGQWQGKLVQPGVQSLAWPRKDVELYDDDFPETSIPTDLKRAQMELAIAASQGIDLVPSKFTGGADAAIVREKVDVIETEYAASIIAANLNQLPSFPVVDALLSDLLAKLPRFRTYRV